MILVLFDIDGTLLLTGGLGQSSAKVSLKRVFGTWGRIDLFYPGGRTIEGIFQDTLLDAGVTIDQYSCKRTELYEIFLGEFNRRLEEGDHHIRPLPGSLALLEELSARNGTLLGLVTGNHRETARLKLSKANINPDLFQVGAFGHESTERSDLMLLALNRAEELVGVDFSGSRTVVLGDTTGDVLSAKSIGAVSLAVTTGTDDHTLLSSVKPDRIFLDLSNTKEVLRAIVNVDP
jgi:phosphoglycolate phosphatase-like HAD superfamily hydrolase